MTFVNYVHLKADELADVVKALKRPGPGQPNSGGRTLINQIRKQGWVHLHQVDDLISAQDARVDWTALRHVERLAGQLEVGQRVVGYKPKTKDHEFSGGMGVSIAGAACLLIWLERLGFETNAAELCSWVVGHTERQTHVSDDEITALWHLEQRHKMAPVTVGTDPMIAPIGDVETFVTSSGYSVEVTNSADGRPAILTVTAPDYVEAPAQVLVTCEDCGMRYVSGYKPDEHDHRIFHRKKLSTLNPELSRAMRAALSDDPDSVWVEEGSPSWQRIAVHRRAKLFKREMEFDFTQWAPASDAGAVGFLFVDDDCRIVGACCFRPSHFEADERMRLDWIWIAPSERRKGWLSRNWQRFVGRFGEFDIGRPISDEMQSFLRKNGLDHLL